ncbi:MAG: NAD-dependent epimerase/dehydratase family protein [Solirubrobacterales bacterium]
MPANTTDRPQEILVTGGAGFVGSNIALALAARHPRWSVTALDNLHRRGSELNVPRLTGAGVRFVEGDVREPSDLASVPAPDVLVECSAEPSVMSGVDGDSSYLLHTNLTGAYNCLELARGVGASFVFLSSSRVYPLATLRGLALEETDTRFELLAEQTVPGASPAGISEEVPLRGARTLYGATKLAAELLIEEFRDAFGLRAVVDRCGVIAGPWQMGKVDQGVFTHWMLSHHFGLPSTTSASAVAESRCVTCCTSMTWSTSSRSRCSTPRAGMERCSTWGRSRMQPLLARDDRAVPADQRARGADRRDRGDPGG